MKAFSSKAEGRKGKKLRMPVDDTTGKKKGKKKKKRHPE